jgi:imidazolonepropionase-like amidohydrolase
LGAATTIVNAKVFDGTKAQDWTSVRFADGLITQCSAAPATQEGDEVINAGGGTVLPGLIDAHVHLVPGAFGGYRCHRARRAPVDDVRSVPDVDRR